MSLSSHETSSSLLSILEAAVRSAGFERFGFAQIKTPVSISLYENWLSKGFHGEMTYLERHLPDKKDPHRLLKRAQSAIVLTMNYVPHPMPKADWPLSSKSLSVATYAQGRDYHHFIGEKLQRVIKTLEERFPDEEFRSFTDSGPVLERDLAQRAGLGWVGKNTCLLDRKNGSLFFLAEIYTTLDIPTATLVTQDHCGTCTRCLDACPTGALKNPRELDARLCISYLTIESRKAPPLELREKMGHWLFGCDICQTVCPWNLKVHGKEVFSPQASEAEDRHLLIADLRFLLTSSNRSLERAFEGTPLMRAGGQGLKRNAIVVAANAKATELREEIRSYVSHEKIGELAVWALRILDSESKRPS